MSAGIPKSVIGRLAKRPYLSGDALPAVGSQCLVSGANADVESDQHRSYAWRTVVGYGEGDRFICLQSAGCWPTVERIENCWFAEIPVARSSEATAAQHNLGNLSLLLADCRQALFDAIKVDAGASVATRFEIGRAVGLMGRAIDDVSVLLEALTEAVRVIEHESDEWLGSAICCSGHDCGCRGSSNRDLLVHDLRAAIAKAKGGAK